MKTSNTLPTWIRAQIKQCEPFWVRPHRLFSVATEQQLDSIFQLLGEGKPVYVEDEDMRVEAVPMSRQDKKLLAHMQSFQLNDFRLDSFQTNSSLYYRDKAEYSSMLQMTSVRPLLVEPNIAVDTRNVAVYDAAGQLVDVFVPALLTAQFFFLPGPDPLLTDENEPAYTLA